MFLKQVVEVVMMIMNNIFKSINININNNKTKYLIKHIIIYYIIIKAIMCDMI